MNNNAQFETEFKELFIKLMDINMKKYRSEVIKRGLAAKKRRMEMQVAY